VTSLSLRFAKAVAGGRQTPPLPATRERLLVSLLRKRAAAQNVGAVDLEQLLRAQILWALPTFGNADDADRRETESEPAVECVSA
jgi:hypothetical protein